MQKSQCLYLAQGNGVLELEGEIGEKQKKKIQKLISMANEDKKNKKKKKTTKQEQNSNQKNNNRQNKTQEIEKINGNGEVSSSLLFLGFCPFQT